MANSEPERPLSDAKLTCSCGGKGALGAGTVPEDAAQSSPLLRGVGAVCRRGQKSGRGPNQDSLAVLCAGDVRALLVLDGHGCSGHEVSAAAQESLLSALLRRLRVAPPAAADDDSTKQHASWAQSRRAVCPEPPWAPEFGWEEVAVHAFEAAQQQLQDFHASTAHLSGTTATLILVSPSRVRAAAAGDSGAVLAVRDPAGNNFRAVQLTRDHRPDRLEEQRRVEAAGGRIVEGGQGVMRLKGNRLNLAVSRSLGDLEAVGCGLTHQPDVGPAGADGVKLDPAGDSFIVAGSDGVWDNVSTEEAIAIVEKFGFTGAQEAAEALATEAQKRSQSKWGRGQADDTTVIVSWSTASIGEAATATTGAHGEGGELRPQEAWLRSVSD